MIEIYIIFASTIVLAFAVNRTRCRVEKLEKRLGQIEKLIEPTN